MHAADENSRDYRDKASTDFTNMPLTYELDGEKYHCVGFQGSNVDGDGEKYFKPDSWEEAQRYLTNGGLTNLGQYGSS